LGESADGAEEAYRYEGSLYDGRISATNCETLARFSPQTAKPKNFTSK
jgi:hypothetical protein